ncbi:MAG: sulfur carrier protein ThiS [bacterium]
MNVKINGELHSFAHSLTIEQILDELSLCKDAGLAVAHNETVISKSQFSSARVNDGDRLEIIHAVAGG